MSRVIATERLVLRPWSDADANDAMEIYEAPPVAHWLTPQLGAFDTPARLDATLLEWDDEGRHDPGRSGHWAVHERKGDTIVGGVSLQYALAGSESLTIAWALAPRAWGHGYAAEAGDALIRWAMHEEGVVEVFAIVQPDNLRATDTAKRIGMEWVTELGHASGGRYQVYRIRHGDLEYED